MGIRYLRIMGIGISDNKLDLIDVPALITFQDQLCQGKIHWPTKWHSTPYKKLKRILLQNNKTEVVERVRAFLNDQLQRCVISRRSHDVGGSFEEGRETSDPATSSSAEKVYGEDLISYQQLTEEQQRVVDFVLKGYNTYIGGSAGTGKSLIIRVLRQELVRLGLAVRVTATTGIAARRLRGATLHHSLGINMHGEFTRRADLNSFDVIIIDEVSMLSKELFEALDYQLRRANDVELPFGGVQVILSGDFMQLGAVCSLSIMHSALFRQNFAMLKLQTPVRQGGNAVFLRQLGQIRRGVVPDDLNETVKITLYEETIKYINESVESGVVNLFPTNKEVEEANLIELDKLEGMPVSFPALLQPPCLLGRWSSTYILKIVLDDPRDVEVPKLAAVLEKYVLEFVKGTPFATDLATPRMGLKNFVLYKIFTDAFAFRVRIPRDMSVVDEAKLALHLRAMEPWLPSQGVGVSLQDIIDSPNGLHTDTDIYTLTRYAENYPVSAPLCLKVGAKVMLRTNLSGDLVNGSIGVVVGFRELSIHCFPQFLATPDRNALVSRYADFLQYEHNFTPPIVPEVKFRNGLVVAIPPATFVVGGFSDTHHYSMEIVALPLSLAYAFTVHKVQGLTLVGRVHLELSRMWPCEHLLYVAMSRVRNPDQLSMSSFHNDLVRCASECLVFDDALPPVERVRVLPHFLKATWMRDPKRRKAIVNEKRKLKQQANVKESTKSHATQSAGSGAGDVVVSS
uniref:ATP-dependent DNA helicase n=1 Tax=Trypanosoma vivax (strain Y486) TaxID=1055687 RepID=G0UBP1_TRYVY|nr:pif1 helicase-like protein [Trypanosoma vivax Y486]